MQTEQLLCWSGMTDTEHSATSGSNEVVVNSAVEQCSVHVDFSAQKFNTRR